MKKLIIRGMDARYFSKKIVEWYQQNKRSLPWRETTDPYTIWLSEVILQQTRVNQGLPYFNRFISTYPTVRSLAAAPLQHVLRLWQGLGYYSRARNLHACAKVVVQHWGGRFPNNYSDLLSLPGIGEYTAAAIASICYHEKRAVVDGNVFRVLARLLGVDVPINSSAGKKIFTELANQLMGSANPALYNQGIMEFGALHCTPLKPNCDTCPFQKKCAAFQADLQHTLPVKTKVKKSKTRYFYYFVLRYAGKTFMHQRNGHDIWKGLYDFLLVEHSRPVKADGIVQTHAALKEIINQETHTTISKTYRHVLSHQIIKSRFVIIELKRVIPQSKSILNGKFYSAKSMQKLPKPILINRFLHDYQLL